MTATDVTVTGCQVCNVRPGTVQIDVHQQGVIRTELWCKDCARPVIEEHHRDRR